VLLVSVNFRRGTILYVPPDLTPITLHFFHTVYNLMVLVILTEVTIFLHIINQPVFFCGRKLCSLRGTSQILNIK
jgi:hypothetical protein